MGPGRAGKLALWQVMARVIAQGSRLSAVRLAQDHAACDILGLRGGFNEEPLYKNLAWLAAHQAPIEQRLFTARHTGSRPALFLYDVTSSYVEGLHNALADWGYNREKKAGKKQVVVGLLCDAQGEPVAVEVFPGNTRDFDTLESQRHKAAEQFHCQRVTFVGDRGMIKSRQRASLQEAGFYYITAITKPQIEKLLRIEVLQMALFHGELGEVVHAAVRSIGRRNPQRAAEVAGIRQEKKATLDALCRQKSHYLAAHPRAKVATALRAIEEKIARFKVAAWLRIEAQGRQVHLREDAAALAEEAKLDGCSVLQSDVPSEVDAHIIHARYKDLALVEQAFRTCKTAMLEMRPWYVWTAASTRGHALVVMLAYVITHDLQHAWSALDLTVEEGLQHLSTLCAMELVSEGQGVCQVIPTPRPTVAQ